MLSCLFCLFLMPLWCMPACLTWFFQLPFATAPLQPLVLAITFLHAFVLHCKPTPLPWLRIAPTFSYSNLPHTLHTPAPPPLPLRLPPRLPITVTHCARTYTAFAYLHATHKVCAGKTRPSPGLCLCPATCIFTAISCIILAVLPILYWPVTVPAMPALLVLGSHTAGLLLPTFRTFSFGLRLPCLDPYLYLTPLYRNRCTVCLVLCCTVMDVLPILFSFYYHPVHLLYSAAVGNICFSPLVPTVLHSISSSASSSSTTTLHTTLILPAMGLLPSSWFPPVLHCLATTTCLLFYIYIHSSFFGLSTHVTSLVHIHKPFLWASCTFTRPRTFVLLLAYRTIKHFTIFLALQVTVYMPLPAA